MRSILVCAVVNGILSVAMLLVFVLGLPSRNETYPIPDGYHVIDAHTCVDVGPATWCQNAEYSELGNGFYRVAIPAYARFGELIISNAGR